MQHENADAAVRHGEERQDVVWIEGDLQRQRLFPKGLDKFVEQDSAEGRLPLRSRITEPDPWHAQKMPLQLGGEPTQATRALPVEPVEDAIGWRFGIPHRQASSQFTFPVGKAVRS